MKKAASFLLILTSFLTIEAQQVDSIIDIRDGQQYNIVKIGQQWWMQENLNIGTRIDGSLTGLFLLLLLRDFI
ncbi:MAG: hypothetical protein ISS19_18615 [Bacteroidales bacterium]|nr:hypothetical protein [Bacteroidales bacterium]